MIIAQNRPYCGHCSLINKQLGANMDVRHSPNECSKKKLSVCLIESIENDSNAVTTDSTETDGGELVTLEKRSQDHYLQTAECFCSCKAAMKPIPSINESKK